MHHLLFYEKASDYAKRQAPFEAQHRDHVMAAITSGEVVLAGSLADPLDGSAMLVFQCESPSSAEEFARNDPYVIHGIVSRWYVRGWQTIGGKAANASS